MDGIYLDAKILQRRRSKQEKRSFRSENDRTGNVALQALDLEIAEAEKPGFLPSVCENHVPCG